MPTSPKLGWVLAIAHADYLSSSEKIFSVNMVRPFASNKNETGSDLVKLLSEKGPPLNDISKWLKLDDDLMYPWKWDIKGWDLFQEQGSDWNLIDSSDTLEDGLSITDPPLKTSVRKQVRSELLSLTEKHEFPFSGHHSDFDSSPKSMVHAIAPFSHSVAPISNNLLRLAGFFPAPGTLKEDPTVILPSFIIDLRDGDKTLKCTLTPKPEEFKPLINGPVDIIEAVYEIEGAGSLDVPKISMLTNVVKLNTVSTLHVKKDSAHLSIAVDPENADADAVKLELAAKDLCPLTMALKVKNLESLDKEEIIRLLVWTFGAGWRRDRTDRTSQLTGAGDVRKVHIFHSIISEEEFNKLFDNGELLPQKGSEVSIPEAKRLIEKFSKSEVHLTDRKRHFFDCLKAVVNNESDYFDKLLSVIRDIFDDELGIEILRDWFKFLINDKSRVQGSDSHSTLLDKLDLSINKQALIYTRLATYEQMFDSSVTNSDGDQESIFSLIHKFPGTLEVRKDIGKWLKKNLKDLKLNKDDLQKASEEVVDLFFENHKIFTNPDRVVPRDEWLTINIEEPISPTLSQSKSRDRHIRGYAVGLRSGLYGGMNEDDFKGRKAWLSNASIVLRKDDSTFEQIKDKDGHLIEGPTTVGSSLGPDGRRVTHIQYTGKHLLPIDRDGMSRLDYAWNDERELPLLGFGLQYRSIRATINNAGAVLEEKFRSDSPAYAELRELKDDLFDKEDFSFLSRAAAGPADILAPKLYTDVSSETRAHHHMSTSESDDIQDVAFLAPPAESSTNPYLKTIPDEYEFKVFPPKADEHFIKCWLNTDIAVKEAGLEELLSDDTFKDIEEVTISATDIGVLRDSATQESNNHKYHPAISALGVRITVFHNGAPLDKGLYQEVHQINRTRYDADKKELRIAEDQFYTLIVKSSVGGDHRFSDGILTLPAGYYAKIEAFSLVLVDHFPGYSGKTGQIRYKSNLGADEFKDDTNPGEVYLAFGNHVQWVETGPIWNQDLYDGLGSDSFQILPPDTTYKNVAKLILSKKIPADWIHSLYLEHHGWHWTGYPVELALSNDPKQLEKMLPSFAGVESLIEASLREPGVEFTDNKGSLEWIMSNGQILHNNELADGSRPSKFSAFVIRPYVRFRQCLKPFEKKIPNPLDLENKYLACGHLLSGRPSTNINERLPAPVLKWSTPLTAGYEADSDPDFNVQDTLPERGRNGHLLVFDERILRTEDMARFGGLGELIEIDVVQTRDYSAPDKTKKAYLEMGPNPIFHRKPEIGELKKFGVEVSSPFGLTYDNTKNAKPAQTAITLFPKGADGRWFMSKVRSRRIILPETLLEADTNNDGKLPLRLEGDEYVPIDFYVDFNPAIGLESVNIQSEELKLPTLPASPGAQVDLITPSRLLGTWLKGRWGNAGLPTWRVQLILQGKKGNSQNWVSLAKEPPHSQPDWVFINEKFYNIEIVMKDGSDPPLPKILRVSDYTEPTWITFIGMFGKTKLVRGDEYSFTRKNIDELHLEGEELPVVSSLDTCLNNLNGGKGEHNRDNQFDLLLVYRPIPPIHKGMMDKSAGAHIATYRVESSKSFKHIGNGDDLGSLEGSYASLLSFQVISSLSKGEGGELKELENLANLARNDNSPSGSDFWTSLIGNIFPADNSVKESLIRPLPQYLGPIVIIDDA